MCPEREKFMIINGRYGRPAPQYCQIWPDFPNENRDLWCVLDSDCSGDFAAILPEVLTAGQISGRARSSIAIRPPQATIAQAVRRMFSPRIRL